MNAILIAAALIVLHGVDGNEISINPKHITTLHPTKESTHGKPNELVVGGVNCVVSLSNGKFLSVVEDCATIRNMLAEPSPPAR